MCYKGIGELHSKKLLIIMKSSFVVRRTHHSVGAFDYGQNGEEE